MLSQMPLFKHDTDGSVRKSPVRTACGDELAATFAHTANGRSQYIMGRRNYTSIQFDEQTGNLNFDICVEKTQGTGETKGYGVVSPPPRW